MLPLSDADIAECAAGVLAAGASILHLHVRAADGSHSLDAGLYRNAIAAVRESVGNRLVIQVTTEACGRYQPDEQMQLVTDLKPEAVSLALAELCPSRGDEAGFADFLAAIVEDRVMPQYILYSRADAERFAQLLDADVIPSRGAFALLVLGRYADDRQGSAEELDPLVDALAGCRVPWAVCCFGAREQAAVEAAIALGGHGRVGFENNLLLADGSEAPDNAALVAQAAKAAGRAGRRLASADDVRALFAVTGAMA